MILNHFGLFSEKWQFRLSDSDSSRTGIVEMLYDNKPWQSVCKGNWSIAEAHAFCRQLGFQGAIRLQEREHIRNASGSVRLNGISCTGKESSISQCQRLSGGADIEICENSRQLWVECGRKSLLERG